jgi:hypothetical protein
MQYNILELLFAIVPPYVFVITIGRNNLKKCKDVVNNSKIGGKRQKKMVVIFADNKFCISLQAVNLRQRELIS